MLIGKTNHFFSVVLPLYRPKGDWINLFIKNVKELEAMLPENVTLYYIVVHDGSTTGNTLDSFDYITDSLKNVKFVYYETNRGKGYALRKGLQCAPTDNIVVTDFDFPYKKKNIVELIQLLIGGYDVVLGKRSESYFRKLPLKRKIISWACVLLKKLFLDLPFTDTQSGIKAFNKAGKQMFLQTTIDRFLADTEFILRSYNQRLYIKEMDIELEPYVEFSNFGVNVIRNELVNFLRLIRLSKKLHKSVAG
jgi:glycosyltransferase involved in cell wall biosynthesis